MRAPLRPHVVVATASLLGALLMACAGTTGSDVVGVSDDATTTTAIGDGGTTTTGAPQVTVPKPGSTGAGQPVTIAFAGDVHYDGSLAELLSTAPETMLAGVADAVEPADLAVVNLESAITTSGEPSARALSFTTTPAALGALAAGGFDVISMANDHALDSGQTGLAETLSAIRGQATPVIGIGSNEDEAYQPFVTTVNGQRIAIIAASQIIEPNLVASWTATDVQGGVASAKRVDRLTQEVAEARAAADTVVVFLHWGTEKAVCPDAAQTEIAQHLVNAGADVVVGPHAHRVLGGGYLGDAYVDYGLGNLQYKAGSADARESGVLVITATGRRIDSAAWHPAQIGADYLPRLQTGDSAQTALARWNERRACAKLADQPATQAPTTTSP